MESTTERLPAMLRTGGAEREAASAELRDLLVRAALAYLFRRQYPLTAFGTDDAESLAEDFAQEAMAIVLRQLDSFRGDSRFTTWTYRIVVNLIADEYRRRAWRRRPLDAQQQAALERRGSGERPERTAEQREVWRLVQCVIAEDLTPRQRQVVIGRFFEEKPLVILAEELNTDKDNVYKLLHDARKRLKHALLARGISDAEALYAFERG